MVVLKYSRTSRKRTPTGPWVSVRLREGEKKVCTKGHIMHQNKYFKAVRPLVTILSIKGRLLDVAFLVWNCLVNLNFKATNFRATGSKKS